MSEAVPLAELAEAERLYRRGAFADVVRVLEPEAVRGSGDAQVFRLLGLAQLRLGVPGLAVGSIEEARRLGADDAALILEHAIALQMAGRVADAVAHYRAASERLPREAAVFVNWAGAHIAVGETAKAVSLARKGTRLAPALPQAHYVLGQAFAAGGRWAAALPAFRRAVELGPRFADGWVSLGIAEYRAGRIDAAQAAMREALTVEPFHVRAATNLGVLMRLTGHSEEAEVIMHRVAQATDAADARLMLASWRVEEDRFADAQAILEAEQPADPALLPAWRMQHALALLGAGETARARAAMDAVVRPPRALDPLLAFRRALLARAEGDHAAAQSLARSAEESLRRNGEAMLPENRIMTCFELAKLWSEYGERRRAFGFWVVGHGLLKRMQPFARAAFRAFVDASIEAFSCERLRDGPTAANRDKTPVFVVGMPRSGTTLVEQILGAHPDAHPAGERAALSRAFGALGGGYGAAAARRIAALDAAALDAAAERYLAELTALAPGAARVVDKMPANANLLGLVAAMLPGAKVIHCVRDPRDTGFSIFTFRFFGEHPYAHDLSDLGWYMGQHARLMAHWCAALPAPPLVLPLVDWVADFRGTLARVLDHVGLPYDAACERFYERRGEVRTVSRKQVRESVNARGLGRWKPYARELAPMIAALPEVPALSDDEVLASRLARFGSTRAPRAPVRD